ncbi:hypothetical protein WA026_013825 [Henosepilachna vigintioctopunctata]|uniref:Guanine nucleotide-binding protein-like 1 n=1 Tax=Henosepilachna vigintioctopunctata TaxID=420089 RepID=A0AAW1V154_9CUCU
MPQGRRKTPFSGKAKKEQLKLKKQRQGTSRPLLLENSGDTDASNISKLNYHVKKNPDAKTNRYALAFYKETDEEIKQRKEIARQNLVPVTEEELEIESTDFFPEDLNFPKRPEWSYQLSKCELDAKENRYFTEYLKKIETNAVNDIGFFELNLETWRQLWRVIEMSDIVLYIVDIRFSALMFPPSLFNYVVQDLKKDFILVLNKIDLAPAPLVVAWKSYFDEKYPGIHIVMFTTLPGYNLIGNQGCKDGLQVRRRRGKLRMAAEGAETLLGVCKSIVGNEVDLSSWENKIQEEMNLEYEENVKTEVGEMIVQKTIDTDFYQHEKYKNGILTIGCVGQPNVGKSSLLNALMGKKVVSVSKTPGHTKHFQTIFLTPNIRLCDCPGLVFPSKVPKTLQVLMGSYPIAQLREPYTTVKFIAERLDLPKLLRITHPENDDTWSAMDICDGWAKKRGFLTAKAARLDSYRAANSLLRMALDGNICICMRPPKYTCRTDFWCGHPEVQKVMWIQAKSNEQPHVEQPILVDSDLSDKEDSTELLSSQTNSNVEEKSSEEEDDETEEEESEEEEMNIVNRFAALQR